MAGNFEDMQVMKIEGAIMQVRDQVALVSQSIQTQNEILRKLLDEQNNALHRIAEEATSK